MKKILLFGATGTIGMQTIEIIKNNLNDFNLVGFSFFNNVSLAKDIAKIFKNALIYSSNHLDLNSVNSYHDLIEKSKPDLIVNAVVGFAGIEISFLAIKNKINLALANKETIAICGDLFLEKARKDILVFPIDSEHSALYELLKNQDINKIKKIFITASGGKYYNLEPRQLNNVTYEEAIKHPVWNMGARISIDSSTMINKFFEIIEAYYYFRKPVEVFYHPQAIIHAGILKQDNGYQFHFSKPDMKYSIGLAINEFQNQIIETDQLDFLDLNIHLSLLDDKRWKPVAWAKLFMERKYFAIPIIVNALDEELICAFQEGKIKFNQITSIIDKYIKKYCHLEVSNLNDIYKIDKNMRELLRKELQNGDIN